MKVVLIFMYTFLFWSCKSISNNFKDYKSIKGEYVTNKHDECYEIIEYYKNIPLNGKYKIVYDNNITYGTYKNGVIVNFYYYVNRKNKPIIKKLFDENEKLLEYTYYQDFKDKKRYYNSNSSYSKYDSVKTYISDNMPYKTIYYDKKIENNIIYTIESGTIKLKTDINDYPFRSDDLSLSWISRFIFSKCPDNKFVYDPKSKSLNEKVKVTIMNKKEKSYKYILQNRDGDFLYEEDF